MSSSSSIGNDSNSQEDVRELNELLNKYKMLMENQAKEREDLLDKVNMITDASKNVVDIDIKMDNLVTLLIDIKEQIMNMSSSNVAAYTSDIANNLDEITLKKVAEEVRIESERLLNDIGDLKIEITMKQEELVEKDSFINELNEQLEQLAFEKSQLITKLESLNSLTEKWNEEITLLQKLAVSDPRYKAIDTLKKHGSLSEIQLAFSMGTSIGQVKRYAEDLIKLNMIKRDSSGRYVWVDNS